MLKILKHKGKVTPATSDVIDDIRSEAAKAQTAIQNVQRLLSELVEDDQEELEPDEHDGTNRTDDGGTATVAP